MAGVRNGCLARRAVDTTGWLSLFTVPAATTVLLKAVLLHNHTTAAITVTVRMRSSDGLVPIWLFTSSVPANDVFEWSGWQALNGADHLEVFAAAAGVYVWVSGADLPGEAAFPLPQTASVPQ